MSIASFAIAEVLRLEAKPIVDTAKIRRMNKGFFSVYGGTFGKRVRLLRQERGWSQVQLSIEVEKFGASAKSAWISELENSEENKFPSPEVIIAFAEALATTTDFLMLRSDNPEPSNSTPELHWSQEADEAGRLIDSLPDEAWRKMALVEVQKVADEWREIRRQDAELVELVRRVEKSGGAVAAAIVQNYITARLDALSRRSDRSRVVDKLSDERTDIGK
jgi:transcriptional regulator with XRE-family HTH domain